VGRLLPGLLCSSAQPCWAQETLWLQPWVFVLTLLERSAQPYGWLALAHRLASPLFEVTSSQKPFCCPDSPPQPVAPSPGVLHQDTLLCHLGRESWCRETDCVGTPLTISLRRSRAAWVTHYLPIPDLPWDTSPPEMTHAVLYCL
jgi:hypothetical protein